MRRRRIVLGSIGVIGAFIVTAVAWGWAPETKKPVESFLPMGSVLYIGWDGTEHHKEAWEKTVAYEAIEKSGLVTTLTKIVLSYVPVEHKSDGEAIQSLLKSLAQNGVSLSVSFTKGTDVPTVVLVLQDAARFEPLINSRFPQIVGEQFKFESLEIRGRKVTRSRSAGHPGFEFGWWADGGHLVAVFGKNAIESVLDVAEGKAPSITSSENWRKFHQDRAEFDPALCCWLDVAALKGRFQDFVVREKSEKESQLTVGQLMKVFGVDRMDPLFSVSAFAIGLFAREWSSKRPAPRTGLLALMDQPAVSLADLPPLPSDTTTLVALSFDWSKSYDAIVKFARELGDTITPNGSEQVDGFLKNLPNILGFDLKRDLFDTLGNVVCFYNDSAAAIPGGFGVGLTVQVKDAENLKKTLDRLFDRLQQIFPNGLTVSREDEAGRTVSVIGIGPLPIRPAVCVDKHWLHIGLSPQSVRSTLLRADGKLDPWKPSPPELAALDSVPKKFQFLILTDPRPTYQAIVTILPFILMGLDQAAQGPGRTQPAKPSGARMALLSEMPPAELMTRSMFPNASVWTVDESGLHGRSRESAPAILGAGAVGGSAVGVALLLPAIQAAREAARRTQSKNNIKQLVLAIHNYHDVNSHFPAGTHPNKDLQPGKRLSWIAEILPYLELSPVHKQIDFSKAWNDPANRQAVGLKIQIVLNPSADQSAKSVYPVTNYVGLGGVGADGPMLPVESPRAGCFGYDRTTKISDIADGTSNTVMISESSRNPGPWAAGGRPTIRALTAEPYIDGPDGLGDSHVGGCLMGLADGSVRFISDKIDPSTMRALVTINGGERIDWDKAEARP